jgi:flagellar M-ring protein FliF
MSFAAPGDLDGVEGGLPLGMTADGLLGFAKYVLIGGVILLAIRMLRPKTVPAAQEIQPTENQLLPENEEMAALAQRAADGDEDAMRQLEEMRQDVPLLDEEIALAQIDGRIKLSALKRIGDAIAAGPAESASVIRQWMNA